MHIAKWKKSVWKDYKIYDNNYMTVWKRQNHKDSKKMSGGIRSLGAREAGMNRQSTGDVMGSETILYDTMMVHPWHHELSKPMKAYSIKSET